MRAEQKPGPVSGAVVVIPCLNERDHICDLISTLLKDADWADPLIVVADGGSTDGTAEIVAQIAARDKRVRLLNNPKRIQAAAVNLAGRVSGAGRRWLVRADAHAQYPPRFVSRLIREAERVPAASVVVSMHTRGFDLFQRAVAHAQNSRLGSGGSAHRTGARAGFVDHGHHALFDLDEFRAVGGYDESFAFNEDAELDIRLRRKGDRIWLTRAVQIVYFPRARPWPLFRQYLNYGRGRARTLLLHRELPRLRQLLPAAVAPAIIAAGATPEWTLAAGPVAAWAAVCCAYGVGIAVARRRPSALLSGPAAMIMHVGWSFGFWTQLLKGSRAAPLAAPPKLTLGTPNGR